MGINFSPYKTSLYPIIKWEKRLRLIFFQRLIKFLIFVFIFFIFLLVFSYLIDFINFEIFQKLLGLNIIFLILLTAVSLFRYFFNFKLKNPEIKISLEEAINYSQKFNLAEFLDFDASKLIIQALKYTKSKKLNQVNSFILSYLLIKNNPKFNFIFVRINLNIKEIEKMLLEEISNNEITEKKEGEDYISKNFQETILTSLKFARKRNCQRIELSDLLMGLFIVNPLFQEILIKTNLKEKDIESLILWLEAMEEKNQKLKQWWSRESLLKRGSLAKEWTAGYTPLLDKYSVDWTEIVRRRGFPEFIGLEKETEQVERILARQEYNNVLVVGEAGAGRRGIVQKLIEKITLGQSFASINYKRMVGLDIPTLLAGTSDQEEVEAVLDRIFQEVVTAGNVILIINEFHNFIGIKPGPGKIDISGILANYLHNPEFKVIAVTAYEGLHQNIEQNLAILNLFEKVDVLEISHRETLMILERMALRLENKYQKIISYPALRTIIDSCHQYIPGIPFPKKAIDLLDEAMIYVSQDTTIPIVLPEHINKIISEKIKIPIGETAKQEKEVLLNLEELIHQRIINQEEAVKQISFALRRARSQITAQKGPMGSFLFLGPTGVGKTETAKALAEVYFGSEKKMIRLDMSEFQELKDISRIIGSSEQEGLLTTPVRETPFSLILLDEIEKAHPNLLNLFLQVLDEGQITDGLGRKVSFSNTIIIATSNAGATIIWENIRKDEKLDIIKEDLLSFLVQENIFKPELINRFDGVVIFKPLTKNNLLNITELILQKIKKNLEEKNIKFIITNSLKEKIVEWGYDTIFGARNLKRVIQDKVENPLAEALLKEDLKTGCSVWLKPTLQDKLEIEIKEYNKS